MEAKHFYSAITRQITSPLVAGLTLSSIVKIFKAQKMFLLLRVIAEFWMNGISYDTMGHLYSSIFQDFFSSVLFLSATQVVSLLNTKKSDVQTRQRSILHYFCLLSNQGPAEAQAPSSREGRQLDRDGERTAWLQINPYCHHDYIRVTHIHTHALSPFGQS